MNRRGSAKSPPGIPATTARQIAFSVLDEAARTDRFAARLLDGRLDASELSAADRRLATELVGGTIRRRATLDRLLAHQVRRPRHQVEGALWTLLRLGAYQLTLLSSMPAHAAIHETVELARWMGREAWCGFVNGVLRSLARSLTGEFTEQPAADTVPVQAGSYRRLREAVFDDPLIDPVGYFASAFSFPAWASQRWLDRFGFLDLVRLGFRLNQSPGLTLRVNSLRSDREAVLAALSADGLAARPGALGESIYVDGPARVAELPGFAEGHVTAQDETAIRACRLLAPQPGASILDLCAGPGTKTTHLAELMGNRGRIIATDIRLDRLQLVESNCRRLGVTIVETRCVARDGHDIPAGPFDGVLVDVPCSNSGVLNRRPEARWRLNATTVEELANLQQSLLGAALSRLKPGGRAVYSTCSLEPEENQRLVRGLCRESADVQLLDECAFLPDDSGDGGFQALLKRREAD